jgi:hypothetical protein
MNRRHSVVGAVIALSVMFCFAPADGVADGDPASDYLIYQPVFTPLHPPSAALTARLIGLANAAKEDGFPIRIAVIQAPIDLGAVPQLLGRPATYARFLGAELRFSYRGRLLVVMQHGYGYTKDGRPVSGAAELLRSIAHPSGSSPDQLTAAAIVALRRIAAAAGHPLPAQPPLPHTPQQGAADTPASSFLRRNVWMIVVGALIGASSITWVAILVVRLRRSTHHDGNPTGS